MCQLGAHDVIGRWLHKIIDNDYQIRLWNSMEPEGSQAIRRVWKRCLSAQRDQSIAGFCVDFGYSKANIYWEIELEYDQGQLRSNHFPFRWGFWKHFHCSPIIWITHSFVLLSEECSLPLRETRHHTQFKEHWHLQTMHGFSTEYQNPSIKVHLLDILPLSFYSSPLQNPSTDMSSFLSGLQTQNSHLHQIKE